MNKHIVKVLYSFMLVCVLSITIASCTTSKSVVSQNANLSKYRYASVINNDTSLASLKIC